LHSETQTAPAPTGAAPLRFWRGVRIALALAPLMAVHLALCAIPFIDFSWWYVVWVILLTRITGLGITVGFHRYLTHRSFKAPRWVQFLLAVAGCTALQKGPLWWVAHHRLHHKHSDTEHDPHSPVVGGFVHGHMGWLFTQDLMEPDAQIVRDLTKYPELVWLERFWMVPGFLMAAACFAVGGWGGLVYGYCLSTVLVFQVTFAVNSIGHLWGSQRFDTGEGSRNNILLGYLAMGDGWHNNHHRAQHSAKHGFAWYELDMSYAFIKLLELFGMAWAIKMPPAHLLPGAAANATDAPSAEEQKVEPEPAVADQSA